HSIEFRSHEHFVISLPNPYAPYRPIDGVAATWLQKGKYGLIDSEHLCGRSRKTVSSLPGGACPRLSWSRHPYGRSMLGRDAAQSASPHGCCSAVDAAGILEKRSPLAE